MRINGAQIEQGKVVGEREGVLRQFAWREWRIIDGGFRGVMLRLRKRSDDEEVCQVMTMSSDAAWYQSLQILLIDLHVNFK